jgi:hypothetical protein
MKLIIFLAFINNYNNGTDVQLPVTENNLYRNNLNDQIEIPNTNEIANNNQQKKSIWKSIFNTEKTISIISVTSMIIATSLYVLNFLFIFVNDLVQSQIALFVLDWVNVVNIILFFKIKKYQEIFLSICFLLLWIKIILIFTLEKEKSTVEYSKLFVILRICLHLLLTFLLIFNLNKKDKQNLIECIRSAFDRSR